MPILYLILGVQIFFLVYTNLSQLQYYLGYDASAVYLQALMIHEQGTLLIEDWIYTSTLTWDTPMLLAVQFYGLCGDIYVSFGLSILLSLGLLVWIAHGLLSQLGASHKAKILFFICLLSPYVTYQDAYNRIDYYGVLLSIFGVYSLKTALMMALWWMFFYLDRPELRGGNLAQGKSPKIAKAKKGKSPPEGETPEKKEKAEKSDEKSKSGEKEKAEKSDEKSKSGEKEKAEKSDEKSESGEKEKAEKSDEKSKSGEKEKAEKSDEKKNSGDKVKPEEKKKSGTKQKPEETEKSKEKKVSKEKKSSGDEVKSQKAPPVPKEIPQKEKKEEILVAVEPVATAESLKTYVYLVALLMSVFISAISSGYHVLLYGILPPLIFGIFRNCRRDKWEKANFKALGFLIGCVVLSLWGKSIQTQILGRVGHDSTLGWTTIDGFWKNLGSIFQGYLELTGALPVFQSPSLFGEEGMFFLCFLTLSLGFLWAGIRYMPLSKKRQKDSAVEYYTFLFWVMLSTFVFIYTTYGAPIFEVRYLIPNFIILILFASLWLAGELDGKNKSWKILLQLVVIPCFMVSNSVSFGIIEDSKFNPRLSYEIIDYLSDHESPVVYLAGEQCIVFGQNIRVLDREKTYIYSKTTEEFTYSGDYTYYLETSEYEGAVPLIMSQVDYDEMPAYFKSLFQKTHEFTAFLSLYECDYNALDYTAGITDLEYNKDYPYTSGITLSDTGELVDGGRYRVAGTGAYVLWGPSKEAPRGIYDITLNYEIVSALMMESEFLGVFDVAVDGGTVIASEMLDFEKTSITLSNVNLAEHTGLLYDYRVAVKGGTELEIISIEMERKLG